ncbi:isochorismatase family protein [Corynebacterium aquilae]|uniref:Isochorismatase-like domain-containing protein n=1 Tax=Corynebacterium aquilae DSM 44791 TaxID=1431546 RepID=A0A1L7CEZ5_9CORY|nr:isochorismatase family protein [Corynebacterium aquilae]APT84450.1 hypothetical protein CAQU_04515 [Corynebacterium aquilae DSM 44791]
MIPTIEDYPHPSVDTVPLTRANWTLDPTKAALLIHDMQEYFTSAYRGNDTINRTTANIARLIDCARKANIPVFYTAQPPNQRAEDRGLLTDLWGTGLSADGREAIVEALTPQAEDTVLTKWRYDAFERSDFQQLLGDSGRTQLIITGIYAHIGVLSTALSAFMKDISPFLVADACADFSEDLHRFALAQAARTCAVVTDTAAVTKALSATH